MGAARQRAGQAGRRGEPERRAADPVADASAVAPWPAPAIDHHRRALAVHRGLGSRGLEAYTLNHLGRALCLAGHIGEAMAGHRHARDLATEDQHRFHAACAHDGLGHVHRAAGWPAAALDHWQHALALFTDLGVPQADEVRAHLAQRP